MLANIITIILGILAICFGYYQIYRLGYMIGYREGRHKAKYPKNKD